MGEMCEPVKVVVSGVISSVLMPAAISQVQRSDAQMIDERREFGSRAERIDAQIRSLPQFLPQFFRIFRRFCFVDLIQLSPLPHRRLCFWIFDVARNSID